MSFILNSKLKQIHNSLKELVPIIDSIILDRESDSSYNRLLYTIDELRQFKYDITNEYSKYKKECFKSLSRNICILIGVLSVLSIVSYFSIQNIIAINKEYRQGIVYCSSGNAGRCIESISYASEQDKKVLCLAYFNRTGTKFQIE